MEEVNFSNNLTPRYPTKTFTGYSGCDKKECAFSPKTNEWTCIENEYYSTRIYTNAFANIVLYSILTILLKKKLRNGRVIKT